MVLDDSRMPVPGGSGLIGTVFPGAREFGLARQILNLSDALPQAVLVKSSFRTLRSAAAAVPFAGTGRRITGLPEQLAKTVMMPKQLIAAILLRHLKVIVVVSCPIAVTACHDHCSRRSADCRGPARSEHDAFAGHPVYVGCLDPSIAIATVEVTADVIRHD